MNIITQISKELSFSSKTIEKVFQLFSTGGTVPFVARYRKEATGNLDEVQLIQIKDRQAYWDGFIKRKDSIQAVFFIFNNLCVNFKLRFLSLFNFQFFIFNV